MPAVLASPLAYAAFTFLATARTLQAIPVNTPPRPVVLVHGFHDTSLKLQPMAKYLRKNGWTVYTPTVTPGNAAEGLEKLASQLEAYINQHCGKTEPIDLVGYSMGGIVSRYYIQRLGGARRVKTFVTISSPHHGTWMGYLSGSRGAKEMRPRSEFLNDLNRDTGALQKLNFTSIWTPLDLMIIPAGSSHMDFGKEKLLWMPAHPLMVWSRTTMRAVAAALRE